MSACNCPGQGKPDPTAHAHNCPARRTPAKPTPAQTLAWVRGQHQAARALITRSMEAGNMTAHYTAHEAARFFAAIEAELAGRQKPRTATPLWWLWLRQSISRKRP